MNSIELSDGADRLGDGQLPSITVGGARRRDDGTGEAEFAAPHNYDALVLAEFARAAADEPGGGGGVGPGYFEAPITPQQMGGIEFD